MLRFMLLQSFKLVWLFFSSIGGGIFFHEFDLGLFRGVLFATGVLIVCVGIFCLSNGSNPFLSSVNEDSLTYGQRKKDIAISVNRDIENLPPIVSESRLSESGSKNNTGKKNGKGEGKKIGNSPDAPSNPLPVTEASYVHSPYY